MALQVATANRTNLELKLLNDLLPGDDDDAANRTNLELKSFCAFSCALP